MHVVETHIVPADAPRRRFSDYAREVITTISTRKGIRKAIERGELIIDGATAETGRWVEPGQRIDLVLLDGGIAKVFPLTLEVLLDDEDVAVINKPPGITVNGNRYRTVEHALPYNVQPSARRDALRRPRPVHRLDAPTSGLLLVAKTASALVFLGRQFQERAVDKRYRAIVIGEAPERGVIDGPVDGRPARTVYETVRRGPSLKNGILSLLDCRPETGRQHQIRIHLASAGFPILGDGRYGTAGMILKSKGLFLCAVELAFVHPSTGETVTVAIDEPDKFRTFLAREERRWLTWHGTTA